MPGIRKVGLIGAGSVGSAIMSLMYAHDRQDVYLVATGERGRRLREGLYVNGEVMHPHVLSSADEGVVLDLLLICVKTYSLESVMADIGPLISPETIILPLQNGITATEQLQERFPRNRVLYGVVIRTDAHRIGHRAYFSTLGEMQLGYADNTVVAPEVSAVCERLVGLGINAHIYPDMRRIQWRKWMLNTGASQVAAETGVECGYFGLVGEISQLIRMCMDEIVLLAHAEGVNVTWEDRDEILDFVLSYPPDKKMSMLQDLEAGRPIEIEDFAGTVVRLGERHGIPTPTNHIMYLTIMARQKVGRLRKGGEA